MSLFKRECCCTEKEKRTPAETIIENRAYSVLMFNGFGGVKNIRSETYINSVWVDILLSKDEACRLDVLKEVYREVSVKGSDGDYLKITLRE